MFVAPDGALVPVDFGIMGRLDRRTRHYLADMLLGFLERDYRRVAEVHFAAGYVPPSKSLDAFMLACRSIGEPIFGKDMHEISVARLLGSYFALPKHSRCKRNHSCSCFRKPCWSRKALAAGSILHRICGFWRSR